MEPYKIAKEILEDAIAKDITIIDMSEVSPFVETMIIVTANTDRHVDAIVNRLKKEGPEKGLELRKVEGSKENTWVLVDLTDVIVHVFVEDERVKYNLERLWGDLPRLD